MVRKISFQQPDFEAKLAALQDWQPESDPKIDQQVAEIIANTKKNGDQALIEYTKKFDRLDLSGGIEVTTEEVEAALSQCDQASLDALSLAAGRIRLYHERLMPQDLDYTDEHDIRLGNLWRPIECVGIYVPGGLASYPSSVIMNAIPARVAGVKEIHMVVPAPDGKLNPLVLAAAKLAKIDRVFKIGGAQAIAALAFGTETVPKVDKVVGPGNAYVATAKRQVFGHVGIDMIAGPSEILVAADGSNKASHIAIDLLSQAEHDALASSFLVTDDADFAAQVETEVENHLKTLTRENIARKSWENYGAIIVVASMKDAAKVINAIAPEHLELASESAIALLPEITNAGAVFLGPYTPEAIGDYTAGPSHVLPTSGTAAFSSGLSVYDFIKRVSLISCSKKGFDYIAQATEALAEKEGLDAHKRSVTIRRGSNA